MRAPAFTETVQIGIVVRDLDAAIERYQADFGIGPWQQYTFTPDNAPNLHEFGQHVARSWRLATAMIGKVQWELIEPLDTESIYAQFLAEKGPGVHHIAVAPADFHQLVATETEQGRSLPLYGTFSGAEVAYLDTAKDLGVLVEIFHGTPQEN